MEHKSTIQSEPLAPRRPAEQKRPTMSEAETREFLSQMRSKDPALSMGIVTESSLTSGIVLATLGTIAFMAVMTVGPYLFSSPAEAAKKPAKAADKTEVAATSAPTSDAATTGEKSDKPQVSKKTMEKLGVDEVKEAAPDVNPLDDKVDDLINRAR